LKTSVFDQFAVRFLLIYLQLVQQLRTTFAFMCEMGTSCNLFILFIFR